MDLGPLMGAEKWGIPDGPAANTQTGLTSVPTPSASGAAAGRVLNTANPLLWWAGMGAFAFGLMAFSTSVRVGKGTASLSVGGA